MRINSNVEAADELTVVQAIVPAAVRLGHAAHWSEHHAVGGLDCNGGGDDVLDGGDAGGDNESKGSPDDNETMVIGQDMLLWGKSNRVPGNQHDHWSVIL